MITIRVFNLNDYSIDAEFEFDTREAVIKEIKDKIDSLDMVYGVKAKIDFLHITNHERFYGWVLRRLYPGYEINNYQRGGYHPGMTDFYLKKDKKSQIWSSDNPPKDYGEDFYLEIKFGGDKMGLNQIEWMLDNVKHKNIKIMLIRDKLNLKQN